MNKQLSQSILFLVIGGILLYLSNGKNAFAFAAWSFPVFLLTVSRKNKKIFSYLVIPIVCGICTQLSFWKFSYNDPAHWIFYLPFLLGLFFGFVFLVDRWSYQKSKRFITTLTFPLAYTSLEFLNNLINPFGTTGSLGYTQYGFLAFSQLASITGIWGLTFMITWFGSIVVWFLDNLHQEKATKGLILYFTLLGLILVYGSLRLQMPLEKETVKITGLHTYDRDVEGKEMVQYILQKDTIALKKMGNAILEDLILKTRRETQTGAKIILWSEVATFLLKSDENQFIHKCKKLALEQSIYLVANPFVITSNGTLWENKVLFFSPKGEVLFTHYKYGGNFLENTLGGNKEIQVIDTPHGNLSSIICWDGDFPSVVQQVGQVHTDILLIPAADWREITPLHSIVAVYRGIENGCSVVRQTLNGLSIMTDPRGKIIAQMNHFETTDWRMTGQVPQKRWWTLYPIIGDLFVWVAMVSLFGLILFFRFPKSGRKKLLGGL